MNINIGTDAVPDRRHLRVRSFLGSLGNAILHWLPPAGISAGGAPPSIMSSYITGGCNALNRNDVISRVISQEVKCNSLLYGSSACCLLHARFLLGLFFGSENIGDIFLRNVCWLTIKHGVMSKNTLQSMFLLRTRDHIARTHGRWLIKFPFLGTRMCYLKRKLRADGQGS